MSEREQFEAWAKAEGYDTAHTYDTDRSRWLFLSPMTADLWRAWQARAQTAQAVPPDVVRDAVAAEREACAALAQGYAGQVGDVAWAVAAAIRGRGNAAIAQQKGGV